jgi:hypothetical protein
MQNALLLEERQPFMAIFYGYFDESGKKGDNLVVTFCGVCAPRQKLIAFEADWQGILRHHGLRSFHMIEALRYSRPYGNRIPKQDHADARIESLKPFVDCMNEHLELGLISGLDVKGFKSWAVLPNADKLGSPDDPYYPAFVRSIQELSEYVGSEDYISLICDEDEETALKAYLHYKAFRRTMPEIKEKTISLSFANDEHFPALQAADMASWLARREAQFHFHDKPYKYKALYEHMVHNRGGRMKMKWRTMYATEGQQQEFRKILE